MHFFWLVRKCYLNIASRSPFPYVWTRISRVVICRDVGELFNWFCRLPSFGYPTTLVVSSQLSAGHRAVSWGTNRTSGRYLSFLPPFNKGAKGHLFVSVIICCLRLMSWNYFYYSHWQCQTQDFALYIKIVLVFIVLNFVWSRFNSSNLDVDLYVICLKLEHSLFSKLNV